MEISKLAVPGAALVMAVALTSGFVKINFNHHHNLPSIEEFSSGAGTYMTCVGTHCEIYLTEEIQDSSDAYISLSTKLDTAKVGDTFRIHLRGYGGDAHATLTVSNAMRYTKSHVDIVVDGPVYSAHATKAFMGNTLTIREPSLFMFHRVAQKTKDEFHTYKLLDEACEATKLNKDRGQPLRKKCIDAGAALESNMNHLLKERIQKYLTPQELQRYQNGEDVYVDGTVMAARLAQGAHHDAQSK